MREPPDIAGQEKAEAFDETLRDDASALVDDPPGLVAADLTEGAVPEGPDEIELVYGGLMRNVRGAQASAAHWEARSLSDDDIEALGYGPDPQDDQDKEGDAQ